MKYDLIAEAYKKLLNESIDHPMIEVDGVMKHRHNSLGQPIHHTDEGIRNFHRWFGDSKTVDEHGRPMVLYHGTGSDVSKFDHLKIGSATDEGWFGKGFYFTPHSGIANQYAATGNPNVMPVYIRAENPHDWRDSEGHSMRLSTEHERYNKTNEILKSNKDSVFVNDEQIKLGENEALNDNQWGLILKHFMDKGMRPLPKQVVERGLRGSTATKADYTNYYGKEFADSMPVKKTLREVVVFDPSQIKSAIGNNGNFSHPTKITESRFDSISSAYLKQINESIDITPIFNLHVDPTRYEVTSQKTSDYDPEQIDVKFRPKLSNTAVPYDYYTQRKRGQHWYEPEIATLSKEDVGEVFERQIPRLKPEYSTEIKTDLSKKLIYRGMSEDEFQNIMKTGKIKSHGDFNLDGQEGLTYFSTDPTSAQFYAHNFAPLNHKATGIHHAYVIGVENPGTGVHIEGTAEHEVGIPHEIDANKIKEIHRGRAYNISDGEYSFKKDWSKGWRSEPTYKPGSHMMPTVHLAWERIK